MKNALKELVKKHFNLVEAPSVEETVVEEQLSEEVVETTSEEVVEETLAEETTESTFAEIKTADGELTLTYEGELGEGVEIFVVWHYPNHDVLLKWCRLWPIVMYIESNCRTQHAYLQA